MFAPGGGEQVGGVAVAGGAFGYGHGCGCEVEVVVLSEWFGMCVFGV